jgi:hypothetical protein
LTHFEENRTRDGETKEGSLNNAEGRNRPRFIVDLPFGHQDTNGPCLRGATLVSASDGGFLIETVRNIPVGTELSISALFPNGYELANFKVTAKTVWKRPCWKRGWSGNKHCERYQYGLEFIQISPTDLWKLNYLPVAGLNLKRLPQASCQL